MKREHCDVDGAAGQDPGLWSPTRTPGGPGVHFAAVHGLNQESPYRSMMAAVPWVWCLGFSAK